MGSLQKNIQLMLEFVKAPLLVRHVSYHTLMTFLMMLSVILLSMLMILLSTRKCDQSSDLQQQLELAPELESDLRDTGLFDRSNNTGSIDMKMDWSVLNQESSFKMLVLTFFSKQDWSSQGWSCYSESLEKLQKWTCRAVGPSLAASFEPLVYHRNITS